MKADVLILGGGGAGTSAALFLARRGARVVLLERGLVGSQASGVNYGGVRQQGRSPEEIPLARRARDIWRRLPELIGTDAEFEPHGHFKLARREEDEAILLRWNEMAAQYGIVTRMIGRNAIRAEHPYLSDRIVAGSLLPEDGSANPRLLAPAIARAARDAGATLLEHHKADHILREADGFVVTVGGREFRAPVLLNCAGYWGGEVSARFGEPVPVSALVPNMVVTEPVPYFCPHNLGVVGGDVYLRQIPRGNVIFGGGRGAGEPEVPASRPLAETGLLAMEKAIALIPRMRGIMIIRSWSGIDGGMPDSLPVMGPSRTTPGLIHAFGFSGHGFMLGPAVGEVLAELVLDGRTEVPLSAFDIGRFTRQDGINGSDEWRTHVA